jgi:two-component system OmpR family response regulator
MNILLVEDDPKTALHVAAALEQQAHTVNWAANGADGLRQARTWDHGLVIIDRMLPQLDGLSLLKRLRNEGYAGPTLILSAMADTEDRVEGLEAGADDYLSKPFSVSELLARVNALLRRPLTFVGDLRPTRLNVADLEMDLLTRTVTRSGRVIDLQDQEFRLLRYMVEHAGRVVTRKMLLEHAWDLSFEPRSNILESHMSRIRTKVDRGSSAQLIETIRGVGYQIRAA